MAGQVRGVQAEIKKLCPNAIYVHCASHCLDLALTKATDVQLIRNAIAIIQEVTTSINTSAKRLHTFIERASQKQDGGRKRRLVTLCETRWVERHESVLRFLEFYEKKSPTCWKR